METEITRFPTLSLLAEAYIVLIILLWEQSDKLLSLPVMEISLLELKYSILLIDPDMLI